jgi:hypothetical protein
VHGTARISNTYTENSSKTLRNTIRKQDWGVASFSKYDRKVVTHFSHFKCLAGKQSFRELRVDGEWTKLYLNVLWTKTEIYTRIVLS